MKNKAFNDTRLLDAMDHIDSRLIAETADKIRPAAAPKSETEQVKSKKVFIAWKQAAALVACALVMGAIIPAVSMLVDNILPDSGNSDAAGDFGAAAGPVSEDSDIMFYRKVARRTLDNGWVYTFTREGMKNGDDSEIFKYVFYGINIKYKFAEKFGGISSEDNLETGYLLFGDGSDAEKRDAALISSILSNDKTDEELLALNPADYTFEVLDKDMFFELIHEALKGEAQAEGKDSNYWDKPYFAFLEEEAYIDNYKFQICCLNETGLIDELFIDILYKTGSAETDYVQLSDLVASGEATAEQREVYELIQTITNDIKENTNYIYNSGSYREKTVEGIDFSRLYSILDDMHNNRFDEYMK